MRPHQLPLSPIALLRQAPRDKLICVLRCARFLMSILKTAGPEGGRGVFEHECAASRLTLKLTLQAPTNIYRC